jgi:prepilin-type N-terminal cleavage/methylation domain-containing protein
MVGMNLSVQPPNDDGARHTTYDNVPMRRGFTLLELTLVTTIAGVIMALAIPRFIHIRDTIAVRGAIGELGAAFSLARHEAIARRSPVALAIDAASGDIEVRSLGAVIRHRALAVAFGISLATNRDSMVYDPRGVGFGLANMTVTVRRGSAVDTLSMSRLGRARW